MVTRQVLDGFECAENASRYERKLRRSVDHGAVSPTNNGGSCWRTDDLGAGADPFRHAVHRSHRDPSRGDGNTRGGG
jgi:hypothetical protein